MRHSTFLEVNLSMLARNVDKIRAKTSQKIIAMVKADAYGNGLVPVSRYLVNECGISSLGCASLGEAQHLLAECPSLESEVMVFSDTEITNSDLNEFYLNHDVTPVLHQKSDVEYVLKNSEFKKLPLILKVNTGMNRLGLSLEELADLSGALKGRGVRHLMTHFACSYYTLKDGDKTHRQMIEFDKAKKILSDAGVEVKETSVSNSGAIEQGFGFSETHIRPGLMLYGPPSVEPRIWDGDQISRMVTKVLKTFKVKKGTPVGYGINVAGEDGFVAILPMGYGDGLMTYASGVKLTVAGFSGRLFARVNMDLAFIMFDASVEGKIKTGDTVEIWNHDNRVITDLANQMKTIPYQLMCGITGRIPRIYRVD